MTSSTYPYLWAACLAAAFFGCDDTEADTPAVDGSPGTDSAPDVEPEPDAGPEAPDPVPGLIEAVDLTRYSADLEFISRGSRFTPDGPHWQATQDHCAAAFLEAGLEIVRQPLGGRGGVNVIGVLPGLDRPAEQVVIGAHYDSEHDCTGADDNATGVAAVLEAARVLGGRRYARTLVFACFDAEEQSLRGSTDFARRARARGDDIRGAFILEMIGYTDDQPGSQGVPDQLTLAFPDLGAQLEDRAYRGDFLLFVADDDPEMLGHLRAAAEQVELPLLGLQLDRALRTSDLLADLRRSDHAALWDQDFPGMMLTDTANFRNPRYHCAFGDDDIDSLDLEFALAVTQATVGAAAAAAGPMDGEPAIGREQAPDPVFEPAPLACDALAGTCDGGQRCTLLFEETLSLGCVPPEVDPVPVDGLCAFAEGAVVDNCANGLICTRFGSSDGEPRCRAMCTTTADCADGEACPWAGTVVSVCAPGCDPFGDDCRDGEFCERALDQDTALSTTFCGSIGAQAEGESCGGDDRCIAGLSCPPSLSGTFDLGCLAWCRVSAPDCGAGRACRRAFERGLPEDAGYCVPEDRLAR